MTFFYLIGMWLYSFGVALASPFHTKARLLCRGRRHTWRQLASCHNKQRCIWIHAASLGEFEQGRPIIEAIKKHFPQKRIVLTFYSPSGYEVRKNYNLADQVLYLPADGPRNARKFIEAIDPEMAFFVKYEFWHFYLRELAARKTPIYGVSMIFRAEQPFFQSYGKWFANMLRRFQHIYIQDEASAQLLDGIGINQYTVAGDTRFDRVAAIAATSATIDLCQRFVSNATTTIVAGSTWPPDEERLLPYINNPANNVKLIIAPHEVDTARIASLCEQITVPYCLYSDKPTQPEDCKVMIINTIGLLSAIYKYGQISYIGGGFGKGIHNTLEAATYGMPVIFGPNHQRFKEACDLLACGAAFTYNTTNELARILESLRTDLPKMEKAKAEADQYVKSMCGATARIMSDAFSECRVQNAERKTSGE